MRSGKWKSFAASRLSGAGLSVAMVVAVLAGSLAGPAPVLAGEEEATVDQVMAKHIEALGGAAALQKLHNSVSKGTVEVPAQGLTMNVTVYEAEPNLTYLVFESEAMGKIEEGTDGKVAWSKHPMVGPRVMEGEELARALQDAVFQRDLKWREIHKKVELVGSEEVDGKPCYKIVATPEVGSPQTWYIDKESYVKVRTESTIKGPMGEFPVASVPSDYKKVDGVLIAHKLVQEMAMQKIVFTITSVEHNVEMPKDRFDPPEEIKSLIEIQKESEEQAPPAEKEADQVE